MSINENLSLTNEDLKYFKLDMEELISSIVEKKFLKRSEIDKIVCTYEDTSSKNTLGGLQITFDFCICLNLYLSEVYWNGMDLKEDLWRYIRNYPSLKFHDSDIVKEKKISLHGCIKKTRYILEEERHKKKLKLKLDYEYSKIFNPRVNDGIKFKSLTKDEDIINQDLLNNFFVNRDYCLLLVIGETATGKTYTVCKTLLEKSNKDLEEIGFFDEEDFQFLDKVKSKYSYIEDEIESKYYYTTEASLAVGLNENFFDYREFIDYDYLIIDEVGSADCGKKALGYIEILMKERLDNFKKTILITNLRLSDIEEYYSTAMIRRLKDKDTSKIRIMKDKLIKE